MATRLSDGGGRVLSVVAAVAAPAAAMVAEAAALPLLNSAVDASSSTERQRCCPLSTSAPCWHSTSMGETMEFTCVVKYTGGLAVDGVADPMAVSDLFGVDLGGCVSPSFLHTQALGMSLRRG